MAAIFGERKIFFKLPRVHCLDTLWVKNFHIGLGDRQEVKTITINNNTKQAIDPINLHTKFYKDELNMFPLKD